jgi:hypothetical protein
MLRVKESFMFGGRIYRVGDLVDQADPVTDTHAHLFEAMTPTRDLVVTADQAPVEQATAAPGEKRTTNKA